MRALTDQEKRTVRLGAFAVAIYLAVFGVWRGEAFLEKKRAEYQLLALDAQRLKSEIQRYETKALAAQKLKDTFHLEPGKLSRATLVAEASAAIQKTAKDGGIQLGPIRETSSRGSAKELSSMQLECSGPIAAVMTFLHRIQTVGYPVVIDSVQINADAGKSGGSPGPTGPSGPSGPPGTVKLSLTIVILDYDQWKSGGSA